MERSGAGPRAWLARAPRALAALQIAAIVVVSATTVLRFHIFAAVDERAHVAYLQEVAEDGRLPWLGRTVISWQVQAINDHVYPRHSSRDPGRIGLAGQSYEAFQPPLYYIVATPAFLIPGNFRDKIIAVRAFDLLLLLAAVAILAVLARGVFASRWMIPFCVALTVVLWPGVIVRAITVSNAALELPLSLLYAVALWRATSARSVRWMLLCGLLLGLCLLTSLTLIDLAPLLLVPTYVCLRERRDRAVLIAVAITLMLPVLILSPWLISNEIRYGALTADALARRMQEPILNPAGLHFGISGVPPWMWGLTRALLPQEWWSQYARPALGVVLRSVPLVLLACALVPLLWRPKLLRSQAGALLATPWVLGVAMLIGIALLAHWPFAFEPRLITGVTVLFALFAAWASTSAGVRSDSLLVLATVCTLVIALVWVYMAGAYYFTNVGAALGIPAG